MRTAWTILKIEDGKVANKAKVRELFDQLKDGKYLIELKPYSKRSNEQNRYYFGLVVPMIQMGIRDMGTELTKDETHEFLKSKFNTSELVNENTGECVTLPLSTTALTKAEFSEYIEKIQRFAAEFLNIVIPDPGVQTSMSYD